MNRIATFTPHGAHVKFAGTVVCPDGFDEVNAEIFRRQFDGALRFIVYDHTAVESFELTTEQVIRTADQHKKYLRDHPPYVVAVVAPRSMTYGPARMWQVLVTEAGISATVVATLDEARDWLDQQNVLEEF